MQLKQYVVLALSVGMAATQQVEAREKLDPAEIQGNYTLNQNLSTSKCKGPNITVSYDSSTSTLSSEQFAIPNIEEGLVLVKSVDDNGDQVQQRVSLNKDTVTMTDETVNPESDNGGVLKSNSLNIQYQNGQLAIYNVENGKQVNNGFCTYDRQASQQNDLSEDPKNAPKHLGPEWLYHPGFYAIIGSMQDASFIFVESKENGLLFHACEAGVGNGDDVIAGNTMPNQCGYLLHPDGQVQIPPDMLLHETMGAKRILTTALKVAAGGAMIGFSNMSVGYATNAAAIGNALLPMDPIGELKTFNKAKNVVRQMLSFGTLSNTNQDHQIVTELLPDPYQMIHDGMQAELIDIVSKMEKTNKVLKLQYGYGYHAQENQKYMQMLKGQSSGSAGSTVQAPTPAPAPSN